MKRLIVDLDDTLCRTTNGEYELSSPRTEMIAKLRQYKDLGFEIAIHTSRNMRTYGGNIGKINANTLPIIIDWLTLHDVPFDEIVVAKPWCGHDGFYIDDRAIRPSEFLEKSYAEIVELLEIEK